MPQNYSQNTTNVGLPLPSTGCPDYEPGNAIAMMTAAIQKLDAAVLNFELKTSAGAIASNIGKVILKAGSAAAMTLAAPVAGSIAAGGNDGQELTILSADAYAYTVTTPSNAINGSKHIATWTAGVGNSLKMTAHNGVWLTDGAPSGVTLS